MRITPKGSPGIYKVLPETIKLEILKEDLIKIYKKEKELEESIINFGYDKSDYTEAFFYGRNETLTLSRSELSDLYNELNNLLVVLDLSETAKLEIYKWAKLLRKELELNDNLFNVFPEFLLYEHTYEKINEKINKQNNFTIK